MIHINPKLPSVLNGRFSCFLYKVYPFTINNQKSQSSVDKRIIRRMEGGGSSRLYQKMVNRIHKQKGTIKNERSANADRYRQLNMSLAKLGKPIQYTRFFKTKNLIQANRGNFSHPAISILKKRQVNSISSNTLLSHQKGWLLQPKAKQQLSSEFVQPYQPALSMNSQKLQRILLQKQLKNERNLLGYNILQLQQKYNFSRFQLHSLYSMYHTLLRDAKGDLSRFKNGFYVILNMMKVAIRPETLDGIFIGQEKMDFQSFIQMYSQIDHAMFQQSIIDYVDILFEPLYDRENIEYDQIVMVMANRITEREAEDIASIIYQQLDRRTDAKVCIGEIYLLCSNCQTFAKKMFRLYSGRAQ